MIDTSRCPVCSQLLEIERRGHLEIYRCVKCGWNGYGTMFPGDEAQGLHVPKEVNLQIVWHDGKVTPKQMIAAKKLIRALDDKPLGMLLQECAKAKTYNLGTYLEHVAAELRDKAAALGLTLIITDK